MATRANIKIMDHSPIIYKHSDGYPDWILPILTPYIEVFIKKRGPDAYYCIAGILREFHRQDLIQFRKIEDYLKMDMLDPKGLHDSFFLSYGIDTELDSGIEYLYLIDLNKKKIYIYHNLEDDMVMTDDKTLLREYLPDQTLEIE